MRSDVRKGIHVAPSESIKIADAADKWIKRVEADGRERTTVRQYRQHANLHIVPRLGTIKLANLTRKRIEQFRDGLLVGEGEFKKLSRPLARKVMTSLKSLLKVNGYAHVADDVTIGRDKRGKGKIEAGVDFPTIGEIKRLVEHGTNPRLRALLLTVALTGLRASELQGLRWSDVDLAHEELHVRQRADRYGKIGSPKSESSRGEPSRSRPRPWRR